MKRLLQCMFLFGILFVAGHAEAQDVITLKDGTDVKAKVIEITTNDVKYKKENYLDGPTYTLSKSAILMIRYKNGDKDIFTNTSRNSNATSQTATSDEEEILNIGSHFIHLGLGWASLTGDNAKGLDNTLGSDLSLGFSYKPIVSSPDFLLNFAFRFGIGTRGFSYDEDYYDEDYEDYCDYELWLNAFNLYISPFELNGTMKLNQSLYLNGFFGFYSSVDLFGKTTEKFYKQKETIRLRDIDDYNRWDLGILLGGSLLFKNNGISISYRRGFVSIIEDVDGFTNTLLIGYTTRF